MRRLAPLLALLALAALLPSAAHASGVTTHAFMADEARSFVQTPELRRLLGRNRAALLAGGAYPDGGYASSSYPGGDYGESSHWERFVNAYATVLRGKPACAPISDPKGPCADEVAHLMGIAAHGIGDELWDWLFEPQAADRGESPDHPAFRSGLPGAAELGGVFPLSSANSMEYAMDMVTIVEHLRAQEISAYPPPVSDLLTAYAAIGRNDITQDGILAGHSAITAAIAAERAAALGAGEYARVKLTMPYTSAHMHDESGGVVDVAQAAAGYYEALWKKLTTDEHPRPTVIAVHPEAGERGVPFDFSARRTSPGPRGGGAETRIVASLSNHLRDVPADGFRLVDDETGAEIAQLGGFPRPGPYGSGDGTHSMMLHPAHDLEPCRWYRVVVTPAIRDHAGATLDRPHVWRFQTRSAPGGSAPDGCLTAADEHGRPGAGRAIEPSPGPHATDALAALAGGDGHEAHHHGARRVP